MKGWEFPADGATSTPVTESRSNLVAGWQRGRATIGYAMLSLTHVRDRIIRQTYREVLPGKFDSTAATVMLLAIGLQESRFEHRLQIGGPARGFWQFERGGGVLGVLNHSSTGRHAKALCVLRGVSPTPTEAYRAIADDDLLACGFARLLLWTDPRPLPVPGDANAAWDCYIHNWRPGKPHRGTWDALYQKALEAL